MRRLLLLSVLALLAIPAAARAETVTESYRVPTVDGALVYVEVTRDPAVKAPVILTYSPYNVLGEGSETQDSYGDPLRPPRLCARRRRRDRHAQLERLLGLRRGQGAAVRRRPRELPREPGVVERQGRDDRRLLRRHHREHGRRALERRARPGRDRPDRGDLALVRLRLLARRPLLGQLAAAHGRGLRHAAGVRLRLRPHAADRPLGDRRGARPDPALRRRPAHREGLRHLARLRRLLARARLPQGCGALRRAGADRARLAGLQRQAGGGRRPVQGARRGAVQEAVPVPGRPRLTARRRLPAGARRVLRSRVARPRHRHRGDAHGHDPGPHRRGRRRGLPRRDVVAPGRHRATGSCGSAAG